MSEDQQQHDQQKRTTGRIKKPKAVFDPSDNYLPRAQRVSSTAGSGFVATDRRGSGRISTASSDSSAMSKEVCVVCGKRESKRTSFAAKNRLISCLECESKIHKLCLNVDFDDFELMRQKYRCESCSPCCVCQKISSDFETDEVLVCSKCTQSYHNQCLQQRTLKAGEEQPRDWKCPQCEVPSHIANGADDLPVKKIHEIIGSQVLPVSSTTTKSTTTKTTTNNCFNSSEASIKRPHCNEEVPSPEYGPEDEKRAKSNYTPVDCISLESNLMHPQPHSLENVICSPTDPACDDIPCVENWSVDQVFGYFHKHFPKEAFVFKDHEIDGRSLLLLKRSDVVKKLPLKLGPSLRIYSVILKIQSQLNDPTLGWN